MTGAVSFVVKIFTEASASVASMVVTALQLASIFYFWQLISNVHVQGGGIPGIIARCYAVGKIYMQL